MTKIKKVVKYIFTTIMSVWYHLFRIGVMKMDKKKYGAMEIAQWFLWYNNVQKLEQHDDSDNYDVYEGLTHLKVQKLLYYAEGVFSAITNKNLFNEKIYAWKHGPVIKEVYEEFFINGRNEIEFNDNYLDNVREINKNEKLFSVLQMVYDAYAGYTAWQLREKTHVVGGPWQVTVDNKGMQKEIDKDLIKKYFQKNIVQINC